MPKNIVIFADGTAQKGGKGNPSNVYKLFNMVENRTKEQIAFYDPGLGTDWRSVFGLAFGSGFGKNILDCYREIYNNFEAGDQIYLFGFSRGAATVRSLSGFIHMFGILPRSRPDLIPQAFRLYKMKNKARREALAAEFVKQHHTMWAKVRFLGVWDTVAALGFPGKKAALFVDQYTRQPMHDFKLSDCVEVARHAISIDEDRKTFLPVLWEKQQHGPADRLKQVWFCGSHTDVGGGYDNDDLSRIPLMWMLKEALHEGLRIYPDRRVQERFSRVSNSDIEAPIHLERVGFFGKLYKEATRYWDFEKNGELIVHESVFERKLGKNNEAGTRYDTWIKAEGLLSKVKVEPWELVPELGGLAYKKQERIPNQSAEGDVPLPNR
ncbi:MAG: DUF2235 domain-containing protein [Bacteroidia bacterium]|nr:DUF2235 domain-containing protein [Bacteroidia bacterium]